MATTNQNRLLTPEVLAAFEGHELYSRDCKKKDAKCIAVFHIGNIRWYFIEGQKDGEDFIFYGAKNGRYPPSQNGHIRSLLRLSCRMAMQM